MFEGDVFDFDFLDPAIFSSGEGIPLATVYADRITAPNGFDLNFFDPLFFGLSATVGTATVTRDPAPPLAEYA